MNEFNAKIMFQLSSNLKCLMIYLCRTKKNAYGHGVRHFKKTLWLNCTTLLNSLLDCA